MTITIECIQYEVGELRARAKRMTIITIESRPDMTFAVDWVLNNNYLQ